MADESEACAVAHAPVAAAASAAPPAAPGSADRALVAVFASPVAAFPLRYAADAGYRGVLVEPEETDLLKELAAFPDIVARAAETLEPHRVTGYLDGLARLAHAWYHKYRVLGEPEEAARLVLAAAVRQVLANGLHLLGISAPDRM